MMDVYSRSVTWLDDRGGAACSHEACPASPQGIGRLPCCPNGRDVQYPVALTLARLGDSARARELATDLQRRFPEDRSVRFGYLPVLRAQLAMNDSDPSTALEALEPAARFDLAAHGVTYNAFFGPMYTVYLRGEAYLAAGQRAAALREFERIVAHRGIVLADPVDALARLQRARALATTSDTTEAARL